MRIRRAVILAAGSGRNLGTLTLDRPTALLEVGGRTLIDRQLDALHAGGVRDVTVVVGHQEDRLRRHLGHRVTFVRNERYRETDSMYALWLAADHVRGGGLVLDADVALTPPLLDRLRWHPAPDALVYDPHRVPGPEEMKVRLAGPYVIDLREQLRSDLAAGANVGLFKFGCEGSARLIRVLDELVAAGDVKAPLGRGVAQLAHRWPIIAIDADGLTWTAAHGPEDLDEHVLATSIEASFPPSVLLRASQPSQAGGAS